jgi:Cu/Ag efflux protein CusF
VRELAGSHISTKESFIMLRKYIVGFAALLLCMGILIADEVTGKITKITPGAKKEPTVIEIGDKKFEVTGKAKVSKGGEEVKKRGKFFKDLKEGDEITIVFDKKDDKVTVTEVKAK